MIVLPPHISPQLVVADVANKFAKSHFVRGVRETNVRLLMRMIIQYLQVEYVWPMILLEIKR